MKYKFKRTPKPYQLRAIKKGLKLDGPLAVLFDPGLGKTKVAIDLFAIHVMKNEVRRGLVLCPISALGVWPREILKDSPVDIKVFRALGKKKAQKIKVIQEAIKYEGVCILMVGYDTAKIPDVSALLLKFNAPFIVCDEIHMLKSVKGIRHKQIYKISQQSKYRLGLTGTLIAKDPLDVFGQYKVLDNKIFGTNYNEFKYHYSNWMTIQPKMEGKRAFPKLMGWMNMDEMSKKLHTIAIRVKDTETNELDPLLEQDIPIPFSSSTRKKYIQMAKELVLELENEEFVTAQMAATKVIKLQQICGGFIMRTDATIEDGKLVKRPVTFPIGTEKLDACVDLIDQHISKHKFIIGCRFIWEINQLNLRLTKAGYKVGVIRGGVSVEERERIEETFQKDDNFRVVIFQLSSATAITLTAGTIGILFSSNYKWDDYWQWKKRIHRLGQKKQCIIYRLVMEDSIDEKILQNLDLKQDFNDTIVDSIKHKDYSWLIPKNL